MQEAYDACFIPDQIKSKFWEPPSRQGGGKDAVSTEKKRKASKDSEELRAQAN